MTSKKVLEDEPAGGAAFKESSEAGGSATSALLTLEVRYLIFVVGGCLCTVGCIAASPVSIPLPKMSLVIAKCFPGEVGRRINSN